MRFWRLTTGSLPDKMTHMWLSIPFKLFPGLRTQGMYILQDKEFQTRLFCSFKCLSFKIRQLKPYSTVFDDFLQLQLDKKEWLLHRTSIWAWSHRYHTILSFSDFVGRELIAEGSQNVWICHVGDAERDGSFDYFAGNIMNSQVQVSMSHTDRYTSPKFYNMCRVTDFIIKP